MSRSKTRTIPGRWRSLFTGRLVIYLLAGLLATAMFAGVLTMTTTAVVEGRRLQDNGRRILEMSVEQYQRDKLDQETTKAVLMAQNRQMLAMQAARLACTPTLAALPALNIFAEYSEGYEIWLLGPDGGVLRGKALPEDLSRAEIDTLLPGGVTLEKPELHKSYFSLATHLGTLLAAEQFSPLEKIRSESVYSYYVNNDETGGFSFFVTADGQIYSWPETRLDDQLLTDHCAEADLLRSGTDGALVTIAQRQYYCMSQPMEDGSLVVAAIPQQELQQSIWGTVQIPLVLFAAAAAAVLLYAFIMGGQGTGGGRPWRECSLPGGLRFAISPVLLSHLIGIGIGVMAVLAGISGLSMTLTAYAEQNLRAARYLGDLNDSAPLYRSPEEKDFDEFESSCLQVCAELSYAVQGDPAMLEQENLLRFVQAATMRDVESRNGGYDLICLEARVFDENGAVLAGSRLHQDWSEIALSARNLQNLKESEGLIFIYDRATSYYIMNYLMDDDSERSVLLFFEAPERFSGWMSLYGESIPQQDIEEYRLAVCAEDPCVIEQGKMFVIRTKLQEDGNIHTGSLVSGQVVNVQERMVYVAEAEVAQLDPAALRDNYAGSQLIGTGRYYVNTAAYRLPSMRGQPVGDCQYWLLYAVPADGVTVECRPLLFCILALGSVLLLGLTVLGSLRFGAAPAVGPASFTERSSRRSKTRNGYWVNGPILGWGTQSGWGGKTPEEKFLSALRDLSILTILTMAVLGFVQGAFKEGTVLRYILNGSWDRNFNIFSCTYVVLVLTACFSASWLVRVVLNYVTGSLGPRSMTMGRLLNSMFKYGAYIIAAMYLLYQFGVHLSVLMASLGLISLFFSPLLNLLLGDVAAGLFLVFEDEYRVGDVVRINNWRGVVLEMTLRTTRLEDMMGNIKVINNSKITEVENLSQEYTTSVILADVVPSVDLDQLEKILKDELPALTDKVPGVVGHAHYTGLEKADRMSVTIRVNVLSREEARVEMEGHFRHELRQILSRHGLVAT